MCLTQEISSVIDKPLSQKRERKNLKFWAVLSMGFFIIVVTTMLVVASKLGSWGEKSFYLQNRLMLVFKYE